MRKLSHNKFKHDSGTSPLAIENWVKSIYIVGSSLLLGLKQLQITYLKDTSRALELGNRALQDRGSTAWFRSPRSPRAQHQWPGVNYTTP